MKDLVSFTFDFFGHVLPGLVILCSISLLFLPVEYFNYDCLVFYLDQISTGMGTVLVIISYVIGFAINPFGRYLYRNVGFRIWNKKVENHLDMFISDKFVLIREFSPKNFEYIERWNTYCAMAHGLAVGSLVLAVVSAINIFRFRYDIWELWVVIFLIAIFLFLVLLHRAVIFSIWAIHDINATISALKLRDKNY